MGPSLSILSSLESLIPQLLMSSFKKERKSFESNKSLVPHFLLLLPAVPHPMFVLPAGLTTQYLKGWVRTPVKVKKAQVYFQKTYLWLILDDYRKFLDVDGLILGGSWIPILKKLIPFEGGAYPFEGGPSNFPPLHYKLRHWAGC